MANTLGIPERTMAQLRDVADTINIIADVDGRLSALQPLVARCTNHTANDAGETAADTNLMALFYSKAHGHPWVLGKNVTSQTQLILKDGDVEDLDATTLFPDHDYALFQ